MYEKLCIHELRAIARDKGVRCPTLLTKAELVGQIEKIESGEQQPYVRDNRGRPVMFGTSASLKNVADGLATGDERFRERATQLVSQIYQEYELAQKIAQEYGLDVAPPKK